MARGFGATRGVSSGDVIVATVNLSPLQPIAGFLFQNRNGGGGGGFGRYFDIETGTCAFYIDHGSNEIVFQYVWSGATAIWRAAHPGSGWHSVGFTYDPGSTANDPVIYVNGASVTVTEQTAPSGTANSGSMSALRIGNRGGTDRNWDGDLARVAWWRNGSPTGAEFASMHSGVVPSSIQVATLIYYNSLSGDTTPSVGSNVSVTGTADQPDPTFGGTLSGNATLSPITASGGFLSLASPLTGNATLAAIIASGSLGVAPGVVLVPELRNWGGSLQAGVTIPVVTVCRLSTGAQVLTLTNQVTSGAGNLAITSTSLVAGTAYMVVGWNAEGSQRFAAPIVAA